MYEAEFVHDYYLGDVAKAPLFKTAVANLFDESGTFLFTTNEEEWIYGANLYEALDLYEVYDGRFPAPTERVTKITFFFFFSKDSDVDASWCS